MDSTFRIDMMRVLAPSALPVSPIVIITAIVLILSWVFGRRAGDKTTPFPIVKERKDQDWPSTLSNAIEKYRQTGFSMRKANIERIILPMKFFDEIKNTPEAKISHEGETHEIMKSHWTGIGIDDRHRNMREVVKLDLTQNIGNLMSSLQDEVVYAIDAEIGQCKNWTEVALSSKLLRIVAAVSARAFVGLPLCRDKEWIEVVANFTVDGFMAAQAISKYPIWLRSAVSPFLTEMRKLRKWERFVDRKLQPLAKSIMETSKSMTGKKDPTAAHNIAYWYLQRTQKSGDTLSVNNLMHFELNIGLAAIHTTTVTTSNAMYDLAAHPEVIPELQAELDAVNAEEKRTDGALSKTGMAKLIKLDSFLKESQRMTPLSAFGVLRHVNSRNGFTLSDGRHLAHGTIIGFANPVNPRVPFDPDSPLLKTSSTSEPLDEFHPFRYANLRSLPGEENKHQFVTPGRDSVSFGAGASACPGRFFAGNEIKLILIELMKKYDIALGPQGQGTSEGFSRPKTLQTDFGYVPDPKAKIYLKSRF